LSTTSRLHLLHRETRDCAGEIVGRGNPTCRVRCRINAPRALSLAHSYDFFCGAMTSSVPGRARGVRWLMPASCAVARCGCNRGGCGESAGWGTGASAEFCRGRKFLAGGEWERGSISRERIARKKECGARGRSAAPHSALPCEGSISPRAVVVLLLARPYAAKKRRRMVPAKPSTPVPSRTSESGSGVAGGSTGATAGVVESRS